MKVIVEKNKETGKWRYYDKVMKVYSSEEWDTEKKAWAMCWGYFHLMYHKPGI
jgi:hypothetical protein